jgi:hypothetical protein
VTQYGQKNETIRGQSKIGSRHEEQKVGCGPELFGAAGLVTMLKRASISAKP